MRSFSLRWLLVALLIWAGASARAQETVKELESQAKSNNPQALHKLGFIYAVGDDENKIKANFSTALNYYKKAADLGNREAQYKLGFIYERGQPTFKSVTANPVLAVKYYKMAAEGDGGLGMAKYRLAMFYKTQYGGLVDDKYSQQIRLMKEAAQLGVAAAQAELSVIYRDGMGGERDNVTAMAWAMVAADQGDKKGIEGRETLVRTWKMKPAEVLQAEKLAEQYKREITANISKNPN